MTAEGSIKRRSIAPTLATQTNQDKEESKRPRDTKLKQQELTAYKPVFTFKTVIPVFLLVGMLYVGVGVVLIYTSNAVKETLIDYTKCIATGTTTPCYLLSNYTTQCQCVINFQLPTEYQKPVYLYYGLNKFYQNNRLYLKSRDDEQLNGKSVSSLNPACSTYSYALLNGSNGTVVANYYAPCGSIANSLFNDSFSIDYRGSKTSSSSSSSPGLIATGIAWHSDVSVKFNNPDTWASSIRPKNWPKSVTELDANDPANNGYKNQDLIVWMRTAALPSFRKFYRIVNHTGEFADSLPAGNYTLKIDYNFPVVSFSGSKYFVITTTSWMGGKNSFLGIAYLTVGSICITLGFVFMFILFVFDKKLNYDINVLMVSTEPILRRIDKSTMTMEAQDLDSFLYYDNDELTTRI